MFQKRPQPDPELQALHQELLQARGDLTAAYNHFNQVLDPELLDACIYRISATTARCNYLLRSIKAHTAAPAQETEDALWT